MAFIMKKRVDELRELERLINYIEGEIRYRHSILSQACLNAGSKTGQPFKEWLCGLSKTVEEDCDRGFIDIWEDSLKYLKSKSCLNKEDMERLYDLGRTLGYLDIESQKQGLMLEKENIHNVIQRLDKSLAGNMKLSVVLGTLGGIFIVVILV